MLKHLRLTRLRRNFLNTILDLCIWEKSKKRKKSCAVIVLAPSRLSYTCWHMYRRSLFVLINMPTQRNYYFNQMFRNNCCSLFVFFPLLSIYIAKRFFFLINFFRQRILIPSHVSRVQKELT